MEIPKVVGRIFEMCTLDKASVIQCVASGVFCYIFSLCLDYIRFKLYCIVNQGHAINTPSDSSHM